jgi:hypothetical protein
VNEFYNGNLRGYIQAQANLDGGEGNWCGTIARTLVPFLARWIPLLGVSLDLFQRFARKVGDGDDVLIGW